MSDFNPDAYLAGKAKAAKTFDPDAYLATKSPKAAAPEETSTWDKSVFNPSNIGAFLEASRDNLPVVGSLATKGAAALEAGIQAPFSDKDFGQIYDENMALDKTNQNSRRKDHGIADIAGSVADSAIVPTPGAGMKGVAGVATRVASNAALGGADTLARTGDLEEAEKAAKINGGVSAAVEAVPYIGNALGAGGKKIGNAIFGVGEGATERYMANPEAVKSAKDFKGVTDSFLDHVDATRQGLSGDSAASFQILKGKTAPASVFTSPVSSEIERISQMGTFSKESQQTLTKLQGLEDAIKSAADESGHLPLEKGKALVTQIDDMIGKARATSAGTQELKALSNIRKSVDGTLKSASPEYAAHMAELAGDTEAAKGIADKFRSDNGAQNLLKRVARGKDEYSADALKSYDQRFGQNFSDDLQNSYAKNAFETPSVNGSRRSAPGSLIGASLGASVAGPMGAATGSALGYAAGSTIDKYGGQIWQSVLDGTLKVGPYAKVLEQAMQKSPAQVAVLHNFLLKTDPKYKALVEGSSPQP